MHVNSQQAAELNRDKKYIALIVGGSFLISFLTILIGGNLASTASFAVIGNGITILGWVWAFGSFMTGLYLHNRYKMFKRLKPVHIKR